MASPLLPWQLHGLPREAPGKRHYLCMVSFSEMSQLLSCTPKLSPPRDRKMSLMETRGESNSRNSFMGSGWQSRFLQVPQIHCGVMIEWEFMWFPCKLECPAQRFLLAHFPPSVGIQKIWQLPNLGRPLLLARVMQSQCGNSNPVC